MVATNFRIHFKDGKDSGDKFNGAACFAYFHYKDTFPTEPESVSFITGNAAVYKQKDFMEVARNAFDGMIDKDGRVSTNFKTDLVMLALTALRWPYEVGYVDACDALVTQAVKAYEKLKKPSFELTAPLLMSLTMVPASVYTPKADDPLLSIWSGTGHGGFPWEIQSIGDSWYHASHKSFSGYGVCKGTMSEERTYHYGWHSNVTYQPQSGTDVAYGWKDKRKLKTGDIFWSDMFKKEYTQNLKRQPFNGVLASELYSFIYQTMMEHPFKFKQEELKCKAG